MKALSIRQPWASMIILGHKDVENRNWQGKHRGTLFIHASKTWDQKGADWITDRFPHLEKEVLQSKYQRGGLIGSVVMTACISYSNSPWFFGKWGFVFIDPKPMKFMPCPGSLNFFDVPG